MATYVNRCLGGIKKRNECRKERDERKEEAKQDTIRKENENMDAEDEKGISANLVSRVPSNLADTETPVVT
jgi:hypothetical protein